MKINVKKINQIILTLIVLIILAGTISLYWLNDAQKVVVAIGVGFGVLNLLGMFFFFNKNKGR